MKHIKKRSKRIAAMFLALVMIVTSVPQYALTVLAAETADDAVIVEEPTKTEETDTTNETENAVAETKTEAETETKTEAETKTETGIKSEIKAEAESVTAANTETETQDITETATEEETLDETQPSNGENADSLGETKQKFQVLIGIPHGDEMNVKVAHPINYLAQFEYAIVEEEITDGEIPFQTFDGTDLYDGETLKRNATEIILEVPQGSTLYFKFVLRDRCVLRAVKETNIYPYQEIEADQNGVYKKVNIQENTSILTTSARRYDVHMNVENATVHEYNNNNETVETLTIYSDEIKEIIVRPDEGYVLGSVGSNSTGLQIIKDSFGGERGYSISIKKETGMKNPTELFINAIRAEDIPTYTVTFDYPENAEISVVNEGTGENILLGDGKKEVTVTEGQCISFNVKLSDNTKGVFAEYTENGETRTLGLSFDSNSATEGYNYGISGYEGEGIWNDIFVNIAVVDKYTVTFKAVHNSIYNGYCYGNWSADGTELLFASVDENADAGIERTIEIQINAGYKLQFYLEKELEGGSITATVDGVELSKKKGDEYSYFEYTPTGDTTIVLDVISDEFVFYVDEGIEYSVYQYNDDTGEREKVELSENNSIFHYGYKEIDVEIKPEEGKRYAATGNVVNPYDYGSEVEYYEYETDEETGIRTYHFNIGEFKDFTLKCYETTTLHFAPEIPDGCKLDIEKFYIEYDDNDTEKENGYWEWQSFEDNIVDKNKDIFFGIHYDEKEYKLISVTASGGAVGSVEAYDTYEEEGWYGKQNWTIYKLAPTAETTVTVKLDALDKYTVTIEKSERIKNYDADSDVNGILTSGITDVSKTFDEIKENTDLTILNIDTIFDEQFDDETGEPPVYIRKVEYKTGDGEFQRATADYFPYEAQYNIKITGDMVIRIDAEPVEEYEVSFEDTVDNYDVKIWETGYGYNEENEDALSRTLSGSDNNITLKNDKEYRFSILPKDGYKTASVILTKEDGTQTQLEERQDVSDELEDGKSEIYYVIGDGYGNTGDLTIKAALTAAYTLGFDIQASGLKAYSWEEPIRIDNKRIAILPEDSYSFYFRDSDNTFDEERYNITVDDAFTLTRDYRRIRNPEYDEYEDFTVFTIKAKDAAQALKAATVNVTLKPSNTISFDYPNQVKYVGIAYYSGNTQNNYKIINNQANVRGSSNILEVTPVTGYDVTVTMTGASGSETLSYFRIEDGIRHYYLGTVTEDKTITITAQRTLVTQKHRIVVFSGKNVSVKNPVNKIPYDIGEYYDAEDDFSYGCEYSVLKGSSISFIAEPYYGYKVESVTAAGEVIAPKEDGSYEFMPRIDDYEGTLVIVRTVKADKPDNPDKPDDPAKKTATVKVTYPDHVSVMIEGYTLENNQLTVDNGTKLSLKAAVTDENYRIKSVMADGAEIPVDIATGAYTITVTADTEIIITTEKKQEEPSIPEKKYTVHITHPAVVYTVVNGIQTDSVNDVVEGSKLTLSVICQDKNYQIKSVKANGADVDYDLSAGGYILTVTADIEVVIEVEKKPTVETKDPTEVRVKHVSNGQLNLSVTSIKCDITLTPTDADGSVLGVKVTPADSVIKASIVSETNGEGTRYYLLLEKPETSVGDKAEIIICNANTDGAITGGTFTVITKAASTGDDTPDTSGLKVFFDGYEEDETPNYVYTGSALTPSLEVTYNGEYLEPGVDYTVKYANNVNVSTDVKPAKVTITGKGSLTGKHDYIFMITPKDIGDPDVKAGSVKVVSNTKATPILAYNGAVLSKKDFDNPKANEKFSTAGTITLKGKGNFKGTRTINVEVVDKAALNKISIKLDNAKNKNLTYDGTEKYPAFNVLDAKKNDITNKEGAYIVVYPANVVSAGTVKFTVIGIGDYTGSITKSYKIKPSAKAASDINVSDPTSNGYTFVSIGVTEYEPIVSLKDGTYLERGRDYTLAYSNNKKVGTAKCKISFIGNYKGVKPITKEFKINPFNLADFHAENIIVTDKTSAGKPGIYKSVPYIIDNEADALVKSSEFKFTYYVDEAGKTEMKGSDGKLVSGKVWVKIEPKNAAKGNYTGERIVSYTIRESGTDLSKAKITFTPSKPLYTGSPLTPACSVELNKTPINNSNNDKYNVRYLSNINKGKATVIITGADGSDYVGSKTAAFTIAASDIK